MANSDTEKLKKVNGGSRPGAGRKPGGMNKKTVERLAIKQAFLDRVHLAADEIFELQMAAVRKGDMNTARDMLDRAFGKAQQHVDHTTDGEKIVPTLVRFIDAPNAAD